MINCLFLNNELASKDNISKSCLSYVHTWWPCACCKCLGWRVGIANIIGLSRKHISYSQHPSRLWENRYIVANMSSLLSMPSKAKVKVQRLLEPSTPLSTLRIGINGGVILIRSRKTSHPLYPVTITFPGWTAIKGAGLLFLVAIMSVV